MRTFSTSTRTILLMAVTAVLSLAAGLGLSRLVVSPAEAAAQAAPPEAGPISVPVERRTLANDVVLRADVLYEDPVAVTLETADLGGPAIVTGQVPEVGATVDAGDVLLEVTGRPVLVLPGELPVYRTLRAGVSGPDVLQLKAALGALGIAAGDPGSAVYDAATAAGVEALYAAAGYPAPVPGETTEEGLRTARADVEAAEQQVDAARRELAVAGSGAPHSERVRLQADVDSAAFRLQSAQAACATPTPEVPCDQAAVVDAQGAFAVAVAARDEGNAAPDTSVARAALTAAERALADARSALGRAQADAITPLPAGEVVYLSSTPRRVDSVEVRRGSVVAGTPVMNVSGAALQIVGSVSAGDAELLEVGSPATVEVPDGDPVAATVQEVGGEGAAGAEGGADPAAAGRTRVVVVPTDLTEEQRAALQGRNVRVTVPVGSTSGEVLAVPLAALTAGPGGEARVERLEDGDGTDGDGTDGDGTTLVVVRTGLAAGGFVEVTPVDGSLTEGDRVVVGVSGAAGEEPEDATEDPEEAEAG